MSIRKKHIAFFTSVTNESLPYLSVTLQSLSNNRKGECVIDVRVMTSGLAAYNCRKIRHMSFDGINISIVDMNPRVEDYRADMEERLGGFYGEESFYPFFIAGMYPRLAKAIYVECGSIIRKDIEKLFDTDLGDDIIGGFVKRDEVDKSLADYRESWVGVDSGKYVDPSAMLMNLNLFRKYRIEDRFLRLLTGYNFDTVSAAADYINFLCKGKARIFNGVWSTDGEDSDMVVSFAPYSPPWRCVGVKYADEFWDIARRTPFYEDVRDSYIDFDDEARNKTDELLSELISHALELVGSVGGFYSVLGDNYLL